MIVANFIWYRGKLYPMTRSRALAIIVDKADRSEQRWAKVEQFISKMFGRASCTQER